jgi:vacuolar-type H+-ATPase subunit H
MKTEIEKIVQADENACEKVEAAKEEAREIRARAQRKAEEMLALREKEFAEALSAELQKTVSETRAKALEINEATDHYLEEIRERKNAVWDELISILLRKVTGF